MDKDPVQASEKLYKAAEEAVKAAAVLLGLEEAERAREAGRWSAAPWRNWPKRRRGRFRWWRTAWVLHMEGFHEARLKPTEKDVEDVKTLVDLVKGLSKYK